MGIIYILLMLLLAKLRCNPCYNGNHLHHTARAKKSEDVVILVIMEIIYIP